eukprot:SM000005S17223  [mRNA]  locus=s5:906609:908423:+ [translate_table: standard]
MAGSLTQSLLATSLLCALGARAPLPALASIATAARKASLLPCANASAAALLRSASTSAVRSKSAASTWPRAQPGLCRPTALRQASAMATTDDKIQLWSMATPNGQKIGIALEELELPYEAHLVDIRKGDQFKPEFVAINPNSKIPAIVVPDGPGGQPLNIFESGAILIYLADKTGKLLPKDETRKWEAIQWLFFQVGGLGPMMGQLGHFSSLPKEKLDSPYPKERYLTEVKRLLTVVEKHLEGQEYLAGEYSIADISTAPWVNGLNLYLKGTIEISDFPNIAAWLERIYARPAVQKGILVNKPA